MDTDIAKWENKLGVAFFKRIGMTRGQVILDFGCRAGNYTIPAALVVGGEGIVYALDRNETALSELKIKAKHKGLTNIKQLTTDARLQIDLNDGSIDILLLYDVLHYFDASDRKIIYEHANRVLKPGAFISVYPKHTVEDFPLYHFKNLSRDDVLKEIQKSDFCFNRKFCATICHDESLIRGCVFNFIKTGKDTKNG